MSKTFIIWLTIIYTVFQITYEYKILKETNARLAALEARPAQVIFVDSPHDTRIE